MESLPSSQIHPSPISAVRDSEPVHLSIVVPVLDERESLPTLLSQLQETLAETGLSYEILFVDDGSSDGSLQILRQLAASDPSVRLLEFVRNYGQTAAMSAGFDYARGSIIIPIDADLQNDPSDIPAILAKLQEGYDVVSCWRRPRHDSFLRVALSRLANRLISYVTGVHLHDYGCTLKGYRRDVTEHIRLYGEMHRFIPVYASWAGARVTEIAVQHHSRKHGLSKYGLLRTLKVPLDLITVTFLGRYSTKPMYVFGSLGFGSFGMGSLLCGITLYQKFFESIKAHRNPILLLAVFLFLAGIQFLLFGLMCELIIRTYHESQGKPIYILRPPRATTDDGS